MRRIWILVGLVALMALVAGCSRVEPAATGPATLSIPTSASIPATAPTATAPTSTIPSASSIPAPEARSLVDSAGILAASGFTRCAGPFYAEVDPEQSQQLIHRVVDEGLAAGGSAGGNGMGTSLMLFVLDEATLTRLAELTGPEGVCVTGQDPNDYVQPGPQLLEGPGWQWIGAGTADHLDHPDHLEPGFITDQVRYDGLWSMLGEGPETTQPIIDFDRQVIVAMRRSHAVTFGQCGSRFEGFHTEGTTIVVDLFTPGGWSFCNLPALHTIYAVALDLDLTGPPPFEIKVRSGPRQRPIREGGLID